jgi:hypothetical protein
MFLTIHEIKSDHFNKQHLPTGLSNANGFHFLWKRNLFYISDFDVLYTVILGRLCVNIKLHQTVTVKKMG